MRAVDGPALSQPSSVVYGGFRVMQEAIDMSCARAGQSILVFYSRAQSAMAGHWVICIPIRADLVR